MIHQIKKQILGILLLIIFSSNWSFAKITLPHIFSDGMVLQQKSKVAIWGMSTKSEVQVITSWDRKIYNVDVQDGKWKVFVTTPKAGGPFSIRIQDGEKVDLNDILIGEVWLASGQSNMEMTFKGFKNNTQPVANAADFIENSSNSQIRLFKVPKNMWMAPLDDFNAKWEGATPESVRNFSAVAYIYAKILNEKLDVPVGIICASWGGTKVEAWMPSSSFQESPEIWVPPIEDKEAKSKNIPTSLYNGMISPLVGYGIKGVIWYQGEQNRNDPQLYKEHFPLMVKEWRRLWNIGDFAFNYVQIAPYGLPASKLYYRAAALREAQLQSLSKIPNSGMAVLMDVGTETVIHPPNKEMVSRRLAYIALANSYGEKKIKYLGPVYDVMQIEENKIILTFKHAESGLVFSTDSSTNFEIAGKDHVFYPARALIKGDKIEVSAIKVNDPIAVRYAFKGWAIGDLFNNEGLPASSFRTDEWLVK